MSELRPSLRKDFPEAPEEEPGSVQDRRFLARMLLFVAIMMWLGLQLAARVAVYRRDPNAILHSISSAIFWVCFMTFIVTWFTKGSFLRQHLKEDVLTAIAIWFSGALIAIVVMMALFMLQKPHP